MKLPDVQIGGVQSLGTVPDKSGDIRRGAYYLSQGAGALANTFANLEVKRLDKQMADEAHNYDIANLNFEAEHYSKTNYGADDPALEGLDVRTTTTQFINGEEVEVPRENIPADEVWPQLFAQHQKDLIASTAANIESEDRRDRFTQEATERSAENFKRLAKRTAEMQSARALDDSKWKVNQLREIGTPESIARVNQVINEVPDEGERREMMEWWRTTKVTDANTADITGAVQNRDADRLEKGWKQHLAWASGAEEYTGPLTQPELEAEAHRYYSHMNQVNSLNGGDAKLFKADIMARARHIQSNNMNGLPQDTAETAQLINDIDAALLIDPDNETLHGQRMRLEESYDTNILFREVITDLGDGDLNTAITDWETTTKSAAHNMDARTRYIQNDVTGLLKAFRSNLQADPMGTLRDYGLDINPDAPIEDIDFNNINTLAESLSQREFAYEWYKNQYNYSGPMLTPNEKGQFMSNLASDEITDSDRLAYMRETSRGLDSRLQQFWAPMINDRNFGRYAALGQLQVDYEEMGMGSTGQQVALDVQRGFRMLKDDPRVVEDYDFMREKARKAFGGAYNNFPGVAANYIDMATALAVARNSEAGRVDRTSVVEALDKVTGGMIESGATKFMAPKAGVTQDRWDDWLEELDASYLPNDLTLDRQYIIDGLNDGQLRVMPSNRSRNDFYILDSQQNAVFDKKTGRPFSFKYDETAPKRRPD